jgi:hypothetical protein
VHGTSTRKVNDLVKALGVDAGISKSEVSRSCAELDGEVAAFGSRSLGHTSFPYLFLDATYCKARVDARVVSRAVVIATGVTAMVGGRSSAWTSGSRPATMSRSGPSGHSKGMTGPLVYWHVDDIRRVLRYGLTPARRRSKRPPTLGNADRDGEGRRRQGHRAVPGSAWTGVAWSPSRR